ncbi:hypothetical protein NBRC3299_1280 [Acetobacter pasteurianus NBRC 3299]|nr:hypothetical protein NBRC3299_1280 [Acetobacter pasteurianus NBRC 3299]
MEKVVGVAMRAAAVHRRRVQRIERPVMFQPRGQVRIGDEFPAKADHVRPSMAHHMLCLVQVVTARAQDAAAEDVAHAGAEGIRHFRRIVPVGFGQRDVGDARLRQYAHGCRVGFRWIVLDAEISQKGCTSG